MCVCVCATKPADMIVCNTNSRRERPTAPTMCSMFRFTPSKLSKLVCFFRSATDGRAWAQQNHPKTQETNALGRGETPGSKLEDKAPGNGKRTPMRPKARGRDEGYPASGYVTHAFAKLDTPRQTRRGHRLNSLCIQHIPAAAEQATRARYTLCRIVMRAAMME